MAGSKPGSSRNFLWLSLVLLIILSITFLLPVGPLDYWFYVRIGRDTVQDLAVPQVDTISWSQFGGPIYYQPWLSAVIFWLVYAGGGLALTFLLRGLLIGVTYGLIWKMMTGKGIGVFFASLLTVLLALGTSNNWTMRPQLFAYPLFACSLFILSQWQEGENRTLWALPLIGLLWANLHGSFILLFVLAGSALLFGSGDRRKLILWIAVAALGTLINPQHIKVWGYVGMMLESPSDQLFSVEWLPPQNLGWQMNIFFAWLLLFAPLVALSKRRLSLLGWIWVLSFGWLALSGTRYVIWFMIILSIQTAVLLSGIDRLSARSVPDSKPILGYLLGCVFIFMTLPLLPTLRDLWWPAAPSPYSLGDTPVKATGWLADHPDIPGPLWNDYVFGSYLAFALPSRKPWMDSRFNAYPPEQWQEYRDLATASADWQDFFDREGVNLLMLSYAGEPALIDEVASAPEWCPLYQDPYAVIFARRGVSEACQ
jgi:hypothetical protein